MLANFSWTERKGEIVSLLVCFVALILALIAYYFPLLAEGREYFVSDHTYFFEPFARLIKEGWLAQHPPLWNPYIYCGSPQLANPSPGIFYFPNFLFVVCSYSTALALILFFHQLVVFAASYLLSRMLRFSVASSSFVGLTVALSGYFFSLPANYTLPATFAWGVLALYALASVAQRDNRLAYVVLSVFSVHWMLMAGRPEIYVPFFIMFGFLVLLMVLNLFKLPGAELEDGELGSSIKLSSRIKVSYWQSLAIGLGILMSMAMLLPVYEWSKLSPRASGLDLNQVFNWSCNWYDYLCLAFSQPLGDLQQPKTLFGGAVASREGYYPFLPSAYIGPVVVTLVFFGLADKTFKHRFYALGAALVAVLLSLGKYGPVSSFLLKALPFLSILRYPVKLLIFVILFLAILAGRGLHALEEGQRSKVAIVLSLVLWSLATAIASTFSFAPEWVHGLLPRFTAAFYKALGHPMIFTSLIGLCFSLFIAFSDKLKMGDKQTMALVVVAALIGSLIVPAFQHRQKTAAPGYYEYEGIIIQRLKNLGAAEVGAVATGEAAAETTSEIKSKSALETNPANNTGPVILPPRLLTVYFDPLKMPAGYQASLSRPCVNGEAYMQYCREMLLPNTCIDWHQPVTFGYESAETKDYRSTFLKFLHRSSIDTKGASDDELARFCKITSTRYVASSIVGSGKKGPTRSLNSRWFKLRDEDPSNNLRMYEVIDSLPRAFVASSWVKRNQEQVLSGLLKGPSLPGAGVYLEEDQKLPPASDRFANFDGANGDGSAEDSAGNAELRKLSGIAPGEQKLPSSSSSSSSSSSEIGTGAIADKVTFLKDQNEHVALSVQCDKDSLVVLNDRFYPGWKVRIDSVPATIYRANGFMRSVYVTKGSHLVEFDYRPDCLRFGLYLAALAILITIVLAMVSLAKPAKAVFKFLTTGQK